MGADRGGGSSVQTVYSYNPNTGEISGVDYSDSTPDVTMTFDRGGRTSAIADAAGNHVLSYNPKGEWLVMQSRAAFWTA
jgi:hypothetical protein